MVWDPWDLLFEFNNENSDITQTPIAALTPVSMPAKDDMPDLKGLDPEEPPPGRPQVKSLPVDNPKATSIKELIPDYWDIPLVRFSEPELYQVVPWFFFKAQNMCEPPWHKELALIHQDEEVQYLTAMFTWFCHWQALRGMWPQLPSRELNLSQEMKEETY